MVSLTYGTTELSGMRNGDAIDLDPRDRGHLRLQRLGSVSQFNLIATPAANATT